MSRSQSSLRWTAKIIHAKALIRHGINGIWEHGNGTIVDHTIALIRVESLSLAPGLEISCGLG